MVSFHKTLQTYILPGVGVETSLEKASNLLCYKGPRLSEIVGSPIKWRSEYKNKSI